MRHTYIIALLLIICSTASAQVYQRMPQYGYQMPRAQMDSALRIPSDTVRNKTGVVRIGTQLYAGNGTYWSAATIDTTDIRYRPTAGDGISITGPYPSQTIAGNPDTLIAGANITLSPSGTKKVTIAANTASLDSLYGGKLDSVVKRGDTLWAFAGGDSTLIGTVSGGGGGTLQELVNNYDPEGNTVGVFAADGGTDYFSINEQDAKNGLYVFGFNNGNKGALLGVYDSTTNTIMSGVYHQSGAVAITSSGNYQFGVGDNIHAINTQDSLLTKFAVGTRYPSSPLHVVGAPRFATDSAAAGYVWTSKDATGQGEWRAASISSGVTSSQLTDSLNSRFGTIITDSIKIGNSWYYDAKVTLTASQIYTLNSSPVIATTAPGAGYSLTVTSAALVYNAGATPFNLDNNFYVIINNGTVYETTSQIVLSNVVTQNIVMMPVVQGIGSLDENQPISIQGEVDVAGGDGTVTIYLSYKKTQL